MSPTYRITPDVGYYFTMRRRYQRQRPFFVRQPIGILFAASPFFVVWLLLWLADPDLEAAIRYMFVLLFLFWALGLAAVQAVLYWRIQAKRSKLAKMTFTFSLSDEGVAASDALSQSTSDWKVYPHAVRFRDGIMLLPNARRYVWLPDSALQGATPEEATELVKTKTVLRYVA
jgi:hypothetical protein